MCLTLVVTCRGSERDYAGAVPSTSPGDKADRRSLHYYFDDKASVVAARRDSTLTAVVAATHPRES
jgi:hypothetical protein